MSSDRQALSPLARQANWLEGYAFRLRLTEQGRVVSVGDGVVWIEGLPSAAMDEVLEFEDGSRGLVFHLGSERIGAILLSRGSGLNAGAATFLTGKTLDIGVGDAFLGRVIDPLGTPLDGGQPIPAIARRALETGSPPIIARDFVNRPLMSGWKMVDTMVPIGKGQRQLVIGDAGTGKSALALDTVLAQKGRDVVCVYVLISQKRSAIVSTIETLRQSAALEFTCVVVAEATAMPGLKYIAPFAGCALAEGWIWAGRDVLVVYDDLTTHARTYRELSLLLHRPPGREAYPGDIFYLHSRLLERSTCLGAANGGGSMTALPLVETEQGDDAGGNGEIITEPPAEPRKFYIDGGEVEVIGHLVYDLDTDGKKLQVVKYTDYSGRALRTLYPTREALQSKWANPDTRTEVLRELTERGISFEELASSSEQPDADPFDLLCHLAWNAPLRTRRQRAEAARRQTQDLFAQYGDTAREILTLLLDRYIERGIIQFNALSELMKVQPFDRYGSPAEIATRHFGGVPAMREAVTRLQTALYQ